MIQPKFTNQILHDEINASIPVDPLIEELFNENERIRSRW